ncbi:MAG: YafY family transcriptional regulator [Spirochaetales bacterium]|nr:YafY family transcriptional regulator [Spirochaetales bacterium]
MKIDRLMSIIMVLLQKERVGAKELAEQFEVSLRTIYRDIDAINLAGIPVYSVSGVGGGFEILKQYKIDKNVFSTTELTTILMGLSSLSNMFGNQAFTSTSAKVQTLIPTEKAQEIELRLNQITIDLSPWIAKRNLHSHLAVVKTAIQKSQRLSFTYSDSHGRTSQRIIEPTQLVLKDRHWYCQGYCLKRKDYRLFRLSRIRHFHILKEHFLPKDFPQPELDFTLGVKKRQILIQLRIHHSLKDQLLDYCDQEDFQSDGEKHDLVNFPFVENDYHYNQLLSFGTQCECLGPSHVRMEIKRRIEALSTMYRQEMGR